MKLLRRWVGNDVKKISVRSACLQYFRQKYGNVKKLILKGKYKKKDNDKYITTFLFNVMSF